MVSGMEYQPWQQPNRLSVFLGKITCNLAFDKYKYYTREKRGKGQAELVLDELNDCVPSANSTEQIISDKMLVEVINSFLRSLPSEKRKMFVRRYWYLSSYREIAEDFAMSENNARNVLLRIRSKLKKYLEKEGIVL